MREIWGEIYTEPIKAFSLVKDDRQKSRLLVFCYWHSVKKVGVKESPLYCLCVGCNFSMCVPRIQQGNAKPCAACLPRLGCRTSRTSKGAVKGEAPQPKALCLSLPLPDDLSLQSNF